MLVTCYEVLLVVLVVAGRVGLLYASAGGGIVACDGETYNAAVGEPYLLLHQTLAERATSNDGCTVIVLHGSCEDL